VIVGSVFLNPLTWRRARRSRVAILALALGACGPDGEPPPAPPPRLSFAQPTYDFGQVVQGTPVEHQFALRNEGGTELTIMNLRSAHDCAATLVGRSEIAPHATSGVSARFDTDLVYGPQRRTITVYSNDPTQAAVMLTVTGEVRLDVAADPPQIYLGVVPPGIPLLREVAVRSADEGIRIGVPETDAPQLALQLADAPDGSAAAVVGIGTARDAAVGPFSAVVRLPTTSARHPVLRIAVTGVVALDAPTPRPQSAATATVVVDTEAR
jgi:hypothetical protein